MKCTNYLGETYIKVVNFIFKQKNKLNVLTYKKNRDKLYFVDKT